MGEFPFSTSFSFSSLIVFIYKLLLLLILLNDLLLVFNSNIFLSFLSPKGMWKFLFFKFIFGNLGTLFFTLLTLNLLSVISKLSIERNY